MRINYKRLLLLCIYLITELVYFCGCYFSYLFVISSLVFNVQMLTNGFSLCVYICRSNMLETSRDSETIGRRGEPGPVFKMGYAN